VVPCLPLVCSRMHRVIRRPRNLKRHTRRSLASELAVTQILIYSVCILYSCSRLASVIVLLHIVNTERPQASKHTMSSEEPRRRQTRLSSRSESSPQACSHDVLPSQHVAGHWRVNVYQEPRGLLDPCRCMCRSRINRSRPAALVLFGHCLWAQALIQ
jgi:hypothetical protein